jgi:hypothetical protein
MGHSFLYARQNTGRIMAQLFILSYSDAVSFRDIRGHLGTIPSIHTSDLLPLLSIQCMSQRDLWVKGGTSERCYRTRRRRTDEQRYAIISPYFDGRIKMNSPYPEITNISFLAKLFFKTFFSLKHLSDYRIVGLSDWHYLRYLQFVWKSTSINFRVETKILVSMSEEI